MLDVGPADKATVLHRALVLIAFACCGLVLLSFTMFARDQLAGASANQQSEITAGVPVTPARVPVHHAKGQPRRFIDGAASTLTKPFRSIVQSDSQWVVHGLPTIFALLVYGFGLGFLARYSRGLT
jgi:hypothetical protein